MPRTARIKSPNSIYHIMVRSISDISLYKCNKDKNKFLSLVKKYQTQFLVKIYAYCIMTNHAHFIIDTNGSDISKIMHSINQSYAQYFNKKYNRHGHVFQDRFKSKIVTNEKYLINLSIYIHNNASDIKSYKNCIEKYKYSSLGIFLGLNDDKFKILDKNFIMNLLNNDILKSRICYLKLLNKCNNTSLKKSIEFQNDKSEYRSERKIINRNFSPSNVINFICKYTNIKKDLIFIKYNHHNMESKALCVFLMRCLCNFKFKSICESIGNFTQSRISTLCSKGINIILTNKKYSNIIQDFLNFKTS